MISSSTTQPQFTTLDQRTPFHLHQCLTDDNGLTFRENAIPMKPSEENVKIAIAHSKQQSEISLHKSNDFPKNLVRLREKTKSHLETGNVLKIAVVALSIFAIAASLFYVADDIYNHPRNNFLLDKADPTRVMATDIGSVIELCNLKEINGVVISKIEERARPEAWSDSGFLGKNDNLIEVMKKDWQTVDKLGITHIELADHIKTIWNTIEKNGINKTVLYDLSLLKGNTINSKEQKLYGKINSCAGYQGDIFFNSTTAIHDGFGWPGEYWGRDLEIKNINNNERLLIGEGVIKYIRKYGFYEGGENNPYRIDPIRLAAVLTGKSYCRIASAIKQSNKSRTMKWVTK